MKKNLKALDIELTEQDLTHIDEAASIGVASVQAPRTLTAVRYKKDGGKRNVVGLSNIEILEGTG